MRFSDIRREDIPDILDFLKVAAERNQERFAKALAATENWPVESKKD